ncbi:BTAD domain-containing putative transcriptional regulator, partial [Streptomyces sp. NPDC059233]
MDIDVLGGLGVFENGVPIAPAAPSERQVLALLAAHADRVVPVDVLAEELRALVPREQAHPVLRAAVRRLSERLDAAVAPCGGRTAATALVRTADGYRLDTGGGRLDVREFAREADAGHLALARGEYATAAVRLRSALRLWKGPAFDGVT